MSWDWEAHRPHLRSRLDRDRMQAVVRELGLGSVTGVRRLGGGLACSTHAIDVSEPPGRLVLKRFSNQDTTAPLEWERLSYAHRKGLRAPEPVAADLEGRWFGLPAILMTRLPGRTTLAPADLAGHLNGLAETLHEMHDTDGSDAAGALVRSPVGDTWRASAYPARSELSRSAIHAVSVRLPHARVEPVLLHGDFHPGNVLWVRGQVSGIVDWSATRIGYRWWEVAYCRADLVMLYGRAAAEEFRVRYESLCGSRSPHLPVWDLVCGLHHARDAAIILTGYHELGRKDLSASTVRRRLHAHMTAALAGLDDQSSSSRAPRRRGPAP